MRSKPELLKVLGSDRYDLTAFDFQTGKINTHLLRNAAYAAAAAAAASSNATRLFFTSTYVPPPLQNILIELLDNSLILHMESAECHEQGFSSMLGRQTSIKSGKAGMDLLLRAEMVELLESVFFALWLTLWLN